MLIAEILGMCIKILKFCSTRISGRGEGAWENICLPVGLVGSIFFTSINSIRIMSVLCLQLLRGIFRKNYSFGFLCLEWIYLEIFIVTLVFDVLPTLGNENRHYFGFNSDSAQFPVLACDSVQPARYAW